MRKVVCLLALVFLASLSAAAQDSTIDLFAGYSYLHTSPGIKESSFKANGGDASIAFNLNRWASFRRRSRRCPCGRNQWDRCRCECRNIPVRTENFIFSQVHALSIRAGSIRICPLERGV